MDHPTELYTSVASVGKRMCVHIQPDIKQPRNTITWNANIMVPEATQNGYLGGLHYSCCCVLTKLYSHLCRLPRSLPVYAVYTVCIMNLCTNMCITP